MYPAETINYFLGYYNNWLGAPTGTLTALANIESAYNPDTGEFLNVCNSLNACGLMQLRPIALADIRNHFGMNINPLDAVQAIVGASAMMVINYRYLAAKNVRVSWAALVVAYNGGWTAGRDYANNGRAPSEEGRKYVAKWQQLTGVA